MKIIKNFLPKDKFKILKQIMLGNNFPWFYTDHLAANSLIVEEEGKQVDRYWFDNKGKRVNYESYYFFHMFYNNGKPNSEFFHLMEPILTKLKCYTAIQIRANLLVNRDMPYKSIPHTDGGPRHTTSILYINTNNGYTLINDKKIRCEENKMLIFDSNTIHQAIAQTDTDQRVVINFNYYGNE